MRSVDWGDGLNGRTRTILVGAITAVLLGDIVVWAAYDQGGDRPSSRAATGDRANVTPSTTTAAPRATAPSQAAAALKERDAPATPTTTETSRGRVSQTTTATTAPLKFNGNYTFVVTLEPLCARFGERFTVTVRVDPGVAVGVIAAHSDGDTHDTMWGKAAGPDGVVTHTWMAPASPGPGQVLVGATTGDGRSGGTSIPFRIVEATGTC